MMTLFNFYQLFYNFRGVKFLAVDNELILRVDPVQPINTSFFLRKNLDTHFVMHFDIICTCVK